MHGIEKGGGGECPGKRKVNKKRKKTYNTGDSLVVTDPTTNPALSGLTRGERTGSRVFQMVWSYVGDEDFIGIYISTLEFRYATNEQRLFICDNWMFNNYSHVLSWIRFSAFRCGKTRQENSTINNSLFSDSPCYLSRLFNPHIHHLWWD